MYVCVWGGGVGGYERCKQNRTSLQLVTTSKEKYMLIPSNTAMPVDSP